MAPSRTESHRRSCRNSHENNWWPNLQGLHFREADTVHDRRRVLLVMCHFSYTGGFMATLNFPDLTERFQRDREAFALSNCGAERCNWVSIDTTSATPPICNFHFTNLLNVSISTFSRIRIFISSCFRDSWCVRITE